MLHCWLRLHRQRPVSGRPANAVHGRGKQQRRCGLSGAAAAVPQRRLQKAKDEHACANSPCPTLNLRSLQKQNHAPTFLHVPAALRKSLSCSGHLRETLIPQVPTYEELNPSQHRFHSGLCYPVYCFIGSLTCRVAHSNTVLTHVTRLGTALPRPSPPAGVFYTTAGRVDTKPKGGVLHLLLARPHVRRRGWAGGVVMTRASRVSVFYFFFRIHHTTRTVNTYGVEVATEERRRP